MSDINKTFNELWNTDLGDYENCKTKGEYLRWVDKWKKHYAEITKFTRQVKPMRKTTSSRYDSSAKWIREDMRMHAHRMMNLRMTAKEWSAEQREATRKEAA